MIPNYLTDTFSAVSGEFANTDGPFIEALNFDPSIYPPSLISLPSEEKVPVLNQFQGDMMKTILTANGRAELFTNPFTTDLLSTRDRLNSLLTSPGSNSSGVDIATALGPSITDLLESLTHFEEHTDRLTGVTEPDSTTAQLPTLERALSVGSSINHIHKQLDDPTDATNSPVLSLFGSIFGGKSQFDKLNQVLQQPDSQISASDLNDVSQSLVTLAENDVKNYTVAVKKLRRVGVASIVFTMKDKPVEGNVISSVVTDFTKGLFEGDETKRNADQVALTEKRLAIQSQTRANTTDGGAGVFNDVTDLFKLNGLFESIPMTLDLLNRLRGMYPNTSQGFFNSYLPQLDPFTTQAQLDDYFKPSKPPSFYNLNPGKFLFYLFLDYLSRKQGLSVPSPGTGYRTGDFWFFGVKLFGFPLSKLMINDGRFNGTLTGTPSTTIVPQIQVVDNGPWRQTTDAEDEIIFQGIYYNTYVPLLAQVRLNIYDIYQDIYWWRGFRFNIPEDPTSGPGGYIYQNGRWILPEPQKPWPPGVINYIFFANGPNGMHWDPQYAASWSGHRDPSDATQPT